ncbi:MAG: class II aldolase/adducin family protein [Pseudomonadota bacterium]
MCISFFRYTIHSALHSFRPDIKCIIHLHTPAAVAVSACSPPDIKDIEASFLPGGDAKISSPASRTSSESIIRSSAWPPLKRRVNRDEIFALTVSKALRRRWRASLLRPPIAERSFRIAASQSSRSITSSSRRPETSCISSSARRLTPPRFSLSRL